MPDTSLGVLEWAELEDVPHELRNLLGRAEAALERLRKHDIKVLRVQRIKSLWRGVKDLGSFLTALDIAVNEKTLGRIVRQIMDVDADKPQRHPLTATPAKRKKQSKK